MSDGPISVAGQKLGPIISRNWPPDKVEKEVNFPDVGKIGREVYLRLAQFYEGEDETRIHGHGSPLLPIRSIGAASTSGHSPSRLSY